MNTLSNCVEKTTQAENCVFGIPGEQTGLLDKSCVLIEYFFMQMLHLLIRKVVLETFLW